MLARPMGDVRVVKCFVEFDVAAGIELITVNWSFIMDNSTSRDMVWLLQVISLADCVVSAVPVPTLSFEFPAHDQELVIAQMEISR